jgi:hypothetical protein
MYTVGARPRPHRRLLADPGHVDGELRGRRALHAADGRHQPLVLRLVLRSASGLPGNLGRADRRRRERRLVPLQVHRGRRLQRQHDPHPDATSGRGSPQGHQGRRVLPRLQPDVQSRRRVGPDPPRPGRRLLDGRQPRPPARILRRASGARTSSSTSRFTTRRSSSRSNAAPTAPTPGKQLRAARLAGHKDDDNAEWKLVVLDAPGEPRMPGGSVGHRWQAKKGEWNLKLDGPLHG